MPLHRHMWLEESALSRVPFLKGICTVSLKKEDFPDIYLMLEKSETGSLKLTGLSVEGFSSIIVRKLIKEVRMGYTLDNLPDKPARHIQSVCYGKLRADICFYDNGEIKRYLTIKNQNLRLALAMAYRTLWMDTFVPHEDKRVMAHTTTLQLREFAKFSQAPDVKAAWPVKQRKRALPTTKVPKLKLEQVDASALNLTVKKQSNPLETAVNNQDLIISNEEEVGSETIIGVVLSIGINPRREQFGVLMRLDGTNNERFYCGGNIAEELARTNAVIGDRIILRSEIDILLCGLQSDEKNKDSTNHVTYEIEKENELCIAHTP